MATEADITKNLLSLQFESAFNEYDMHYLHLRLRSYALTVTACAQATYFVGILNELRQVTLDEYSARTQRTSSSRIMDMPAQRNAVKVGIIGCGRLGRQLATSLMAFAGVRPEELFISTRRPELLRDYIQQGVLCTFNNRNICSQVHLLFICVLPSQFSAVAKQIRPYLNSEIIVYSLVGAITIDRILQTLQFDNVIRPEFSWPIKLDNQIESYWDTSKDIIQSLFTTKILASSCPLSVHKEEEVVNTSEQWAEVVIMAFINMCIDLKLNKRDSIKLCNLIVLGLKDGHKEEDGFVIEDFQAISPNDTPLPRELNTVTTLEANARAFTHFNFKLAYFSHTHVGYKVCHKNVRKAFSKNYLSKFGKAKVWKGF